MSRHCARAPAPPRGPALAQLSKIVATRCQIFRLKVKGTEFDFGWGSAPDPDGELTALPQVPLA